MTYPNNAQNIYDHNIERYSKANIRPATLAALAKKTKTAVSLKWREIISVQLKTVSYSRNLEITVKVNITAIKIEVTGNKWQGWHIVQFLTISIGSKSKIQLFIHEKNDVIFFFSLLLWCACAIFGCLYFFYSVFLVSYMAVAFFLQ